MKKILALIYTLVLLICISACSTTKSKDEVKGFKRFYHNTTSKFNGYFNAEELMKESMLVLQDMHADNYNTVLSVYDYVEVPDPKAITADMDKAIEKASTVATIHDIGNYVDDCYVLIGKAQYLKHDYIGAEETFQYFEEVFDPKNPYGRVYSQSKSKTTVKDRRKALAKERKEREKEREEAKKEQEEERKERAKERKEKEKERKRKAKERKKNAKKNRGRSDRSSRSRKTSEERESEKIADDAQKQRQEQSEIRRKELEEQKKLEEEEEKRRQELKEKKRKEQAYENEGEGAIFKNKTAYTEGLYWLARTYIETERYSTADYTFKKLEAIEGLSDRVKKQLPAARAHYFMKVGDYPAALRSLEEAINTEKDKRNRGRYAFIRAQIYDRDDNYTQAFEEYQRAKKLTPDFEMKFNAELNILKLSFRTGKMSQKQAMAKLNNMLGESKNSGYADQIYFTIGQIELNAGNVDKAIASFEQAIASSSGNPNVKLETYYKLAELLYDQELYSRAKENYDQAFKLMSSQDERYRKVERMSKHLTDIADNIAKVQLQDSLLKLSLLSEAELLEVAEKIITSEAYAAQQAQSRPMDKRSNIITSNRQLGAGRSSFFAYNPVSLNQGRVEFNRTWGDRVLEDNWRRSLRADATTQSDLLEVEEAEEVDEGYTEEQLKEIVKEVPRNEIQRLSSHKKIQNALFQLGILFRERLRNYERSVASLERLVREYPDFEKRDEALFYLYLGYDDLGQMKKVNEVKAKLVSEFPDSKFTKLATDPSYAESLKAEETSVESYYTNTYRLFEQGAYEEVIARTAELNKLFPDNEDFRPKFDMISAMSYGSVEGKERYIKELESLVKRHPNTPEETRAKEILRFLRGDREAFASILYEEAIDKFVAEPEKLHYVFVVVYDMGQREFDQAKININKYNKKYHRFDNLKISNIYLNQDNKAQIILVRSFKDKDAAMQYYSGIQDNKAEFIGDEQIGFDAFPSTQRNYREVIKQRGVSNYRIFFDQNYLDK